MFQELAQQHEQSLNQTDNQQEAPAANPEGSESVQATADQAQAEAKSQAIADLSKFEKFMLDGKEMTFDELKKQRMLEADYRRKTQELSEERRKFEAEARYSVNLPKDLDVLLEQPWRAAEFYKLYPTEYHHHARRIEQLYKQNPTLWAHSDESQQQQSGESVDVQSLVEQLLDQRLKPIEQEREQVQVEKHLAAIEARETQLKQKYRHANMHEVYAAAEYLARPTREYPEGRELSDAEWDRVFKDSHERMDKLIKQAAAEQFQQQKKANTQLKDVSPGGGVPGEAPVVPKSIAEATQLWMKGSAPAR